MFRLIVLACIAFPMWAGDVRFSVQFTPAAPSLSDTIRVDVSIEGDAGENLVIDAADVPPNCVRIQSVTGSGLQQRMTLEPLRPGDCTIPPFQTRCLRGRTESCGVRSSAIVIPISTVVADPENADIRDKDELPLPFREKEKKSNGAVIAAGIAGGLIVLSGLGYALLRRWLAWRAKPATRALRLLKELPAGDFTQLMSILRDYLDERVGFGADRCTSPELAEALRERSLGQGSTARVLVEFLLACDRGRFAGVPSSPGEFEGAVENCDTLIQCLDFDIDRRLRAGL